MLSRSSVRGPISRSSVRTPHLQGDLAGRRSLSDGNRRCLFSCCRASNSTMDSSSSTWYTPLPDSSTSEETRCRFGRLVRRVFSPSTRAVNFLDCVFAVRPSRCASSKLVIRATASWRSVNLHTITISLKTVSLLVHLVLRVDEHLHGLPRRPSWPARSRLTSTT